VPILVLPLVVAGCSGSGDPAQSSGRPSVPDSTLAVEGGTSGHFDTTVRNALDDVFAFWRAEYPTLSGGTPLPPLSGGLFSVDASSVVTTHVVPGKAGQVACLKKSPDFIIDNAAYCSADDSIVWDRADHHLVSVLDRTYGDLLVALVFAHEFSHGIQAADRLDVDPQHKQPTIKTELQADCSAGAFIAHAQAGGAPHFAPTAADVDRALSGLLLLSDNTPTSQREITHGNGFDRLSAFDGGFRKGLSYCFSTSYLDGTTYTQRPWAQDADYGDGGNESLSLVLNAAPAVPKTPTSGGGLQPDLNLFWRTTAQAEGKTWQDVQIRQAAHPPCAPSARFGYCPDDDTVYYDTDFASSAYYSLTVRDVDPATADVSLMKNQPADFALGTLFAVGWAMAARHQLLGEGLTDEAALLGAVCLSGAYAKDINLTRDAPPRHIFIMSPPDMDEATYAVLNLVGRPEAYGARGTTGIQRVESFIQGYAGGVAACS
jgi:predicted metalloprotease